MTSGLYLLAQYVLVLWHKIGVARWLPYLGPQGGDYGAEQINELVFFSRSGAMHVGDERMLFNEHRNRQA